MSKTIVLDVETNGLRDYTRMWCAVTYCLETKEWRTFDYANSNYLSELAEYLSDATQLVGHNIVAFDRHVLAHFLGIPLPPVTSLLDTLILSRLYNSGRLGGHSLERWGSYFGLAKVPYDAWDAYHPMIIVRCKRDVEITVRLLQHLHKEGKYIGEFPKKLEHKFADILDQMRIRGFPFDIEAAERSVMEMDARLQEMEQQFKTEFPAVPINLGPVVPRRKADGEIYANTRGLKHLSRAQVIGPFTLIDWQEFDPGSSKQVRERMYAAGWQPVEFTKPSTQFPEGQAKVSVANLDTLPDDAPPSAALISKYLKTRTQVGLVKNWMEFYDPKTKRIHGNIIGIGTITHRGSHSNPNTGNITKGPHRAFWGFTDGDYRIAGVDAKGIQLRILAHLTLGFTEDTSFREQVLHGDPHTQFTLPLVAGLYPEAVAYEEGVPDDHPKSKKKAKDKTKRFIYAWLLGAGAQKVGSIFGLDASAGKVISDAFVNQFPGLLRLKEWLSVCSQKGWFPCPGGGFIPIKSEHYALSVALQGIEQRVMKIAAVLWTKERDKKKWDAHLIAWSHDEYQIEGHKDVLKEAGEYMAWCIAEAGRMLKLRCPMEGDAPMIGMNWNETH